MSLEGFSQKRNAIEKPSDKSEFEVEPDIQELVNAITEDAVTRIKSGQLNLSPHNLEEEFSRILAGYAERKGKTFVDPFDYHEYPVDYETKLCFGSVSMFGKDIAVYIGPQKNGFDEADFNFQNLTEGLKKFVGDLRTGDKRAV